MSILLRNRKTEAEQILVAPHPMGFAATVAFVRASFPDRDWTFVESW